MTASPRSRSRSYENRRKNHRQTSWSNSSTFSNCSRHKLSQSETSWTPPLPLEAAENLTVVVKNKNASTKKRKKEKRHRRDDRKKEKPYRRDRKKYKYDRHTPEKSAKEVFASGDNILVSVSFSNKKDKSSAPSSSSHVKDKDILGSKDMLTKRDMVTSHSKHSKNDYDYDRYRERDRNRRSPKRSRNDKHERDRENNNKAKTSTATRYNEKPVVKHRKIDIKPVAIIDLDRSPFKEMTPSPKDIIVLSDDSDIEVKEVVEPITKKINTNNKINKNNKDDKSKSGKSSPIKANSEIELSLTPPLNLLDSIFPDNILLLGGPKTPPEVPSVVKFSMAVKSKNAKLRPINLLHDEKEEEEEDEKLEKNNAANDQTTVTTTTVVTSTTTSTSSTPTSTTTTAVAETTTVDTSSNIDAQINNKVGPNTPPDPRSFSPDTYDPFEPTKSPSNSSIPPDNGMNNNDEDDDDDDNRDNDDVMDVVDDNDDDDEEISIIENETTATSITSSTSTAIVTTSTKCSTASVTLGGKPLLLPENPLNPVEFVMALINKTTELKNSNCDNNIIPAILEKKNDKLLRDCSIDDSTNISTIPKQITVLSNILFHSPLKTANLAQQQLQLTSPQQNGTSNMNRSIDSSFKYNSTVLKPMSSTPLLKSGSLISKLPLPGSEKLNLNCHNNSSDDIPDLNDSSPYSPRSSDYEDLFEPPSDTGQVSSTQNIIRNNNNNNNNINDKSSPNNSKLHSSTLETFDNLFGSISPTSKIISSTSTLYRNKINKNNNNSSNNNNKQNYRRQHNNFKHVEDDEALLDDVPSSAVELQIKDKVNTKHI